jgi:hypothetical protein
MIEVRRLGTQIGAEINGVDVKTMDEAAFGAIYRAWLDYNVIAVRGQDLQLPDFLAYSRRFGVVTPHPSKSTRHPDCPEITLLGANKFRADGTLDQTPTAPTIRTRSRLPSSTQSPSPAREATPCSPACTRRTRHCLRG